MRRSKLQTFENNGVGLGGKRKKDGNKKEEMMAISFYLVNKEGKELIDFNNIGE